ncbi:hypothetical protein BB757_009 [Pseudomonas phage vB_Pae-TbilisiM32]|uniref:Uncharacterized protein n=1 Tax=Pseudomonas phage vB_Pae-TbilisiM32 TaxID=1141525 RepID=A0A1I9SCD2_9CAUD|nr:hypothetical protein BB757_009 [Pseudomonas phage vB_Pae-TbilisiM32]
MNPIYVVRLKDGTTRQVQADYVVASDTFVELWRDSRAVALYPAFEVQEVFRTDCVQEGE